MFSNLLDSRKKLIIQCYFVPIIRISALIGYISWIVRAKNLEDFFEKNNVKKIFGEIF